MTTGARPSFIELIIQSVKKSVETLTPEAEEQLRSNLASALGGPFVDGHVITASYLNLVESRLRSMEREIGDLRAAVTRGKATQATDQTSTGRGFRTGED
jgi:hypothetical protein